RAAARIALHNPTTSTFELEATAQLFRAADRVRVGPAFPLVLPIQEQRAGRERTTFRIYPGARVQLGALVPEPLAPGAYVLAATLAVGRERVKAELPVVVAEGDFPAQAALLPRVVAAVAVSPPQVELSVKGGGTRI